jgi:cystathionine beta-lyase
MLGSVTAAPTYWERLSRTYGLYGQYVSPDDAYLCARGLRTMGVRLKRHEESALKIARWLESRSEVAQVLHPALESAPGHQQWKRDFAGSSGLFGFVLEGAHPSAAAAFVDSLSLFGIGYSWGGFESLAIPAQPKRSHPAARDGAIVRLHIGLEDADDLIEDLARALDGTRGA